MEWRLIPSLAADFALEVSPCDLGLPWTWLDALALTLRYQVPIIPATTHSWWEVSGKDIVLLGIPLCMTAERYAFLLEIYHWLAWPLFLIGVATQVFRGRSG